MKQIEASLIVLPDWATIILLLLAIATLVLFTLWIRSRVTLSAKMESFAECRQSLAVAEERCRQAEGWIERYQDLQDVNQDLLQENSRCKAEQARLSEALRQSGQQAGEQQTMLNEAKQQFSSEFELLAQKIFDEKGRRLTEQSQAGLNEILSPLKQQLDGFRSKVEEVYRTEGQERSTLKSQIEQLARLNEKVTTEAGNLTRALKGDSKFQGNWGELILERVLEQSGLREGHEFEREVSFTDADGQRLRPDVIVHLPQGKDVVVDAKVSLLDYEKFTNGDEPDVRDKALRQHVQSIKNHINSLSKKRYEDIVQIRSLDMVLMFIPIEAAFLCAVEAQPDLFNLAFEKKIVVVTPTTLLATLRTIEHIWRFERQNVNAQKIADKAASIYDKFRGFVEDMERIGSQLDVTRKSYDSAMNKLSSGRGNLVRQAQDFVDMGIRVKQKLPDHLVENDEMESQDLSTQ
ncbi:MAG: DNA recombination protein RmuC [Parasphingorhabdus sp.]|jgi:DNA recombination protein RmuC